MKVERAKAIIAMIPFMGDIPCNFVQRIGSGITRPDGMTANEEAEINTLWNTMPGHTCFMDALRRIARGKAVSTPE